MIDKKFKELMNAANKIPEKDRKVMHNIIIATQLLYYNFYNKGYFIDVQYGKQYMNPPALYLKEKCKDDINIINIIDELWGSYDIKLYLEKLDLLTKLIAEFIYANANKRNLNIRLQKDPSIYYRGEYKLELNQKIKYVRAMKMVDANNDKICIFINKEDFRKNIWNKFNPEYIDNYTIKFNYEEEPIHAFSILNLKNKKDFKMQIEVLHFNASRNEITLRLLLTIINNYEDQYIYEFDETFLGDDFIEKYIINKQ